MTMVRSRCGITVPVRDWPAAWPACPIFRNTEVASGRWDLVPAPEDVAALARQGIAAVLLAGDVHPWECAAANHPLQVMSGPTSQRPVPPLPPIAAGWRAIASPQDRSSVMQQRHGALERACMVAMPTWGASSHALDLGRPEGDMPIERLLLLGRERVLAAATEHLIDGAPWAAHVLAHCAEAPCA